MNAPRRWVPALLARVRDVDGVRHDYPVLLRTSGHATEALRPLRSALDDLGAGADSSRRRDLLALEAALRRLAARDGPGPLSAHLAQAERVLLDGRRSSDERTRLDRHLALARETLPAGVLVGCDADTPLRVVAHVHGLHEAARGASVRAEIDALARILERALAADDAASPAAWTAAGLQAAVSPAHAEDFDFGVMARQFVASRPRDPMPLERRQVLVAALATLREQRVFRDAPATGAPAVFHDVRDALAAWRRRLTAMAMLLRAARIARWQAAGGGDAELASITGACAEPTRYEQALCPSVLVALDGDRLGRDDAMLLLDAFAAGLPVKALVTTSEAFAVPPGAAPAAGGAWRGCLAALATGLGSAWVVQTTAAHLPRLAEPLAGALSSEGPALVFAYVPHDEEGGLPIYLRAAAAADSRAFVPFVFDPARGSPALPTGTVSQPGAAWPTARLQYEDRRLQTLTEELAFTTADFLAADARYADRFRPLSPAAWDAAQVPVADWLALDAAEQRACTPYVAVVDGHDRLQRLVPDDTVLEATRRAAAAWRTAQRRLMPEPAPADVEAAVASDAQPAVPGAVAPPTATVPPPAATPAAREPSDESPWVETQRCTSCNECIKANGRLFAYDDNRQAYIHDASAGSYRDLVEAAERCALALIHPGVPLNPHEPDLDELARRAAPFR